MADRGQAEPLTVKLLVTVDGRSGELWFEQAVAQCTFEYLPDGADPVSGEASLIEAEPGVFSLLTGACSHEVKVSPHADGYLVEMNGQRSIVEVRDPRSTIRKGRAGSGEGRQQIASPMPGKVVRVLVTEGDSVEAGTGLVVVEAMKMQNEMKAPKAGRVTSVSAREGATVAAGEVLAEIE